MIGKGIRLPIGKYRPNAYKELDSTSWQRNPECVKVRLKCQERLCSAQGHPMPLADGEKWNPRDLVPRRLPHSALKLWDRLGRPIASPKLGPWDWRVKHTQGVLPLEDQAQPGISYKGTVTIAKIRSDALWCCAHSTTCHALSYKWSQVPVRLGSNQVFLLTVTLGKLFYHAEPAFPYLSLGTNAPYGTDYV